MEINDIMKALGLTSVAYVSFKLGKYWGYYKSARFAKELLDNGDICIVTSHDEE